MNDNEKETSYRLSIEMYTKALTETIFLLADSGNLLSMSANEIKLEVERRLNPEKAAEKEEAEKRKKTEALFGMLRLMQANFEISKQAENTRGDE